MTVRMNTRPRVSGTGTAINDLWDAITADTGWQQQAACRVYPTEWWFPNQGETSRRAVAVCNDCPVRDECLDYAIDNRINVGIWGGHGIVARGKIARKQFGLPPSRTCPDCDGPKNSGAQRCLSCLRARSSTVCRCGARKHHVARVCRACYLEGLTA